MLRQVSEERTGQIVLIVQNEMPKASGKPSSFLYRVYRWLDRKLFASWLDAFDRKDVRSLFAEISLPPKWMMVHPRQTKYSDYIQPEDLSEIAEANLDVMIRLGFRILRGDILKLPQYGIWSYHHGDADTMKGGPPCFWEVMKGSSVTGSVLQILGEKLDAGQVLYRSWSRTDPVSVNRNAQKVYWKSLYFLPRILRLLATCGTAAYEQHIARMQAQEEESFSGYNTPPENLGMLYWAGRLALRTIKSRLGKKHEPWQIYIGLLSSSEAIDTTKLVAIPNPERRYYADPFIWEKDGQTALFFEDYDEKAGKAVISARLIEPGNLQGFQNLGGLKSKVIIEEPYHLSYPFLLEAGDALYLIPESAQSGQLTAYRCVAFPFQWEKVGVLMDVAGYDPTLHYHDGRYWLFINQKPHPMASSFDELYLYSSSDLFSGIWEPHPQNPIVSDVRCARPAGRIFKRGDYWIRPAQDSAKRYGHRIKLQKIIKWTTEDYQEETMDVIEPWEPHILGTHTINFYEEWVVMDGQVRS